MFIDADLVSLTLSHWVILHAFLSSAYLFFQYQFFRYYISGIPFESQTVWIQIRLDVEASSGSNCTQGSSADDRDLEVI